MGSDERGDLLLIAHRGGRGFGLENTLAAMEAAVRAGVRWIETDIRQTLDGELVICHDATIWGHVVGRTAYETLKKHAPERPLLGDVLEKLAGWVRFNIEVKDADARAVGEMLEAYDIASSALVTSFDMDFLRPFRELFPDIDTGFLYRMSVPRERKLDAAAAVGARVILPYFPNFDAGLVEQAHARGLEIYAWTVKQMTDFRRLREFGVDGVITDIYLDIEKELAAHH